MISISSCAQLSTSSTKSLSSRIRSSLGGVRLRISPPPMRSGCLPMPTPSAINPWYPLPLLLSPPKQRSVSPPSRSPFSAASSESSDLSQLNDKSLFKGCLPVYLSFIPAIMTYNLARLLFTPVAPRPRTSLPASWLERAVGLAEAGAPAREISSLGSVRGGRATGIPAATLWHGAHRWRFAASCDRNIRGSA